jgi:membrane associated rhomboid family serine protease
MGLEDREYMRPARGPSPLAQLRLWTVTHWLIAINVVVFILSNVVLADAGVVDAEGRPLRYQVVKLWGYFSLDTAIYHGQVWRFITFQFLHANLTHILFNMLGLYMFGRLIEEYLGGTRYLAFYLISGIGGPLAYVLLYYLNLLNYPPQSPLVGASAGLFGVLIASAMVAPNMRVQMLFPPVELTMKQMAWVYLAIAAATVYFAGGSGQANAGGVSAHLGGAAVGFLLIKNPRLLSWADGRGLPRWLGGPKMRIRY